MWRDKLVPWLFDTNEITSIPNKNDIIGCTFVQIDITSRKKQRLYLMHTCMVDSKWIEKKKIKNKSWDKRNGECARYKYTTPLFFFFKCFHTHTRVTFIFREYASVLYNALYVNTMAVVFAKTILYTNINLRYWFMFYNLFTYTYMHIHIQGFFFNTLHIICIEWITYSDNKYLENIFSIVNS